MILHVGPLAENPLDAAAQFHAEVLPRARGVLAEHKNLLLVFAPAGHDHRAWRLAAVQGLARSHAPLRVNALAAASDDAIDAASRWLTESESITGQYLPLDGNAAGRVLYRQQ